MNTCTQDCIRDQTHRRFKCVWASYIRILEYVRWKSVVSEISGFNVHVGSNTQVQGDDVYDVDTKQEEFGGTDFRQKEIQQYPVDLLIGEGSSHIP